MPHIVIDARESGTSTGRYVDKLIDYLAILNEGPEFTILTKPNRVEFIQSIAPRFKVVAADIKEFTVDEQLRLKKQIELLKPDLVHFSMVQQPVLYRGKVVHTIHDLTMTWEKNPSRNPAVHFIKQQVYKRVIKMAARKSLTIITPTKYVRNEVIKFSGQPKEKFIVTYESSDKIKDKPNPIKQLVGKEFLMYVGRPMPHKNLDRLIDAFEIMQTKHPDLYLVLGGKLDSNYKQVESRVKARGIKNVYFTDFVSEGQLRWLYENCQAYVFPSISEGFGLPGIEAMVHGAPVVSSNATCLPEVYGEAAKYFDPYDVSDMATVISEVIDNQDLRSSLIQMGHMQAKKYSWKRMAEQTLDIYKKALG